MSEFPAAIDLSTLNGTTGFRIDGINKYDRSGFAVAGAGDVNGDGFADLIIGAPNADPGGDQYSGQSYVVFGKASGFSAVFNLSSLNGANGFRIDGKYAGDESGLAVAGAGDVNGDGFADVIVGAFGANADGNQESGETYVVFGKATGFAAAFDLASIDGSNGFRLDGIERFDYSGFAVAGAGDVNGDGFADLIVGAYFADGGVGFIAGESYVVFGKTSGFGAELNLSDLDGANGFRLNGIDARDQSGRSVAAAGDVNGDGFADLIIGARHAAPGGDTRAGESYVVFGKASGFSASLSLGSLDGSNGFRLDGVDAFNLSGVSVAGAGDVNGDGFSDLLIGASGGAGQSYVVFGKESGFGAAVDLATLNGSNGFRLNGINGSDRSGCAVASAGDVNGDGFADLLIGAEGANGYTGESYVVFGKASGFAASINLSSLDGSNGFRLAGLDSFDRSGHSLASAGDVNGDGFGDIIIGAYGADKQMGDREGESYVIFGRAPDAAVNRIGAAGNQYINGGAFDDTLSGLGGNDRLEGHDGADQLIGGDGIDTASYQHSAGGLTVDLATPANNRGNAFGDTYTTIERFLLGRFTDAFIGDGAGNRVDGSGGNDSLQGAGGNDSLLGGAGADTLKGGDGFDLASYANADAAVGIDLSQADANTGEAAGDTYQTIEGFILSQHNDRFSAEDAAGAWRVLGRSGHDTIGGGADADVLFGGDGADELFGFDGADRLDGGTGADSLWGNGGLDVASYGSAGAGVTVDLANLANNTGDAEGDTYNAIARFNLSRHADRFLGSSQADSVTGGLGSDTLGGEAGGDRLNGNDGDDTLTGGEGADILAGGAGADTFLYIAATESTPLSRDRILGFSGALSDEDLIDLEAVFGSTLDFRGAASFTGAAGEVRVVTSGARQAVNVDLDGGRDVEMRIVLLNGSALVEEDFML